MKQTPANQSIDLRLKSHAYIVKDLYDEVCNYLFLYITIKTPEDDRGDDIYSLIRCLFFHSTIQQFKQSFFSYTEFDSFLRSPWISSISRGILIVQSKVLRHLAIFKPSSSALSIDGVTLNRDLLVVKYSDKGLHKVVGTFFAIKHVVLQW